MPTYRFTDEELESLRDALRKGASRHLSYARFYKNREADKHKDAATRMNALLGRLGGAAVTSTDETVAA